MKRHWIHLMRKSALIGGVIAACATGAAEPTRWYVQANAAETGDGLSWKTAFDSPRTALTQAKAGDEIWVAEGVYHPDPADRSISFQLKEDVALYGGFSGVETGLGQRDRVKHPTVLSGDIGKGDKTKNTITILLGADRAVLDGFVVTGAYSTDQARMHLLPSDIKKNDMPVGGGMRNFKVAPTVRNCVFRNNCSAKGGAVYNVQDATAAAQAQFIGVTFSDNTALIRGGGVSNDLGAMPTFIDCQFLRNVCEDKGGGIYNDFAASPILLNCLLESNRAVSAAAIGNDGGSSPLLVNVTIENNRASSGLGNGLYQGTGADNDPILINSRVDEIYNWHEDTVAVLNSNAPAGQTVPLKDFIPQSTLEKLLDAADLLNLPATGIGYQANLDGATLKQNPLVEKLLAIYTKCGGAIDYRGAYRRPEVTAEAGGEIIRVVPKTAAAIGGDGSSWEKAMTDLQQAIDKASTNKASIWIKEGTYTAPTADRSRIAAFILYDGVKLYGGFAGTETDAAKRDPAAHPTILSANVADGSVYPHVIYGADNTVLDGLTIRDGRAEGFTCNGKGGGLLAYHAGKTYAPLKNTPSTGFVMQIDNCRFVDNRAIEGGAIYVFSKGKLTISNTTFENNRAEYGGAVLSREGNVVCYTDCVFRSNLATADGGATYEDYGAHTTFQNCVFADNQAQEHGGAIYVISRASQLEATEVTVNLCRFERNRAPEGQTLFQLDSCKITVTASNLDEDYTAAGYLRAKGEVRYQRIGEYSVERLNKILTGERAAFSNFQVEYPAAKNAVTLYKVVYDTVVPEDGNRPVKASGLIAVPQVAATRLPMLSYQHGTVFSRDEVPSDIEKSPETRLAVAAFAARGYIVIAADYLGKGVSGEPEAWLVKESSAQACADMLTAARSVLAELQLTPAELFLCGWSQGTLNTAALLQRLENTGIPVTAAGFASAPNDVYLCFNRWIHVPSPLDVNWLTGAAALMIHSCEHYYKLPGLAAAAIKPEYQQTARDLYQNRIPWETAAKTLPFHVKDLFQPEFIEQYSPAATLFFQQLQANRIYNWRFKTPTFYYYGIVDEVVTPYMVQLPVEYQKTLGGTPPTAVSAGEKANHRGTFLFSLADQQKRFDAMRSKTR